MVAAARCVLCVGGCLLCVAGVAWLGACPVSGVLFVLCVLLFGPCVGARIVGGGVVGVAGVAGVVGVV